MNTSELTNKALVLRRLADQFDNIALRQISLDNESAALLSEFREMTPSPTYALPAAISRAPKPAEAKKASWNINPATNPIAAAVIHLLEGCIPHSLHRDELLKRVNSFRGTSIRASGLSQYTSNLKKMGLITNPERGFWKSTA